VRVFLIPVKRPYVQLSSPGQTEGWMGGRRNGWMGGFAKVDNRFGHEKWTQGGSIGF